MRVWDDHNWVHGRSDGRRAVNSRGLQQAHALVISNLLEVENFPLDAPKRGP
jgi:hypothetical protein